MPHPLLPSEPCDIPPKPRLAAQLHRAFEALSLLTHGKRKVVVFYREIFGNSFGPDLSHWENPQKRNTLPVQITFTNQLVAIFKLENALAGYVNLQAADMLRPNLTLFGGRGKLLKGLEEYQKRLESTKRKNEKAAAHAILKGTSLITEEVLTSWNEPEIGDLIADAKSCVDIIDSHFDEITYFKQFLVRALAEGHSLALNVYMLDPKGPFGAQRMLEKLKADRRRSENASRYASMYEDTFDADCKRLRTEIHEINEKWGTGRIKLNVFTYPGMPRIRMFAVDEENFVVGWYPAHNTNPGFPCVLIRRDSAISPRFFDQLREFQKESATRPMNDQVGPPTTEN